MTMNRVAALEALYGDGAWEIAKAMTMTPEQKRAERARKLNQAAVVGNTLSAGAGTAAIYSAFSNRKTGGMPRDLARNVGPRLEASKRPTLRRIGTKLVRGAAALDKPSGWKGKVAAGVLGGAAVGMQAGNAGMDALSAKLLKDKQKGVAKSALGEVLTDTPLQRKGKLLKVVQTNNPLKKQRVAKRDTFDFTAVGEVTKALDDKRQVFGWVSVTEINGEPVVDRQGDYVSIEEIEKAAHQYMADSRRGGDMHDKTKHVSDLIESIIITPEKKAALGLPDTTPTGWFAGFQIRDEETWRKVKAGERPMFSVHGVGRRVPKELD